ncbi:MAG: FkbM family methyltransferase, partial [Vicinamibacterales bacterium]
VFATSETRRWRRQGVLSLDPVASQWLNEHVRPGDVMYDIGAGVGAYSILAAVKRGATVVAFEPGFAAFKGLCDNLLLNGCYRSVVPLPVSLGDRTGLLELEYLHDAGDDVHALRPRVWKTRRDSLESHYAQPVCAERLDDIVTRHGLPAPNVVRVAVRRGAEAVLVGATRSLRAPGLRSILVSVKDEAQAEGVVVAARRNGFAASVGATNGDHGIAVHLERTGRPGMLDKPSETFRRAAERFRRLW